MVGQTDDSTGAAVTALQRLAAGDLRAWHGVPPGCTPAVVGVALGAGQPPGGAPGTLAGTPMTFQRHGPATTPGIVVWYLDGAAEVIEMRSPRLMAELTAALGAPDASVPSGLVAGGEQQVFASRGLIAHVAFDGRVERLYGYAPAPLAEVLAGPLYQAGTDLI
jgi:hypothetical protein